MPNRTLCDVLAEMRKCFETRNFYYLMGLVEEAQTMGDRMEGALWDQNDFRSAREELDKAKSSLEKRKSECRAADETLRTMKSEIKALKREKHQLLVAIHQGDKR